MASNKCDRANRCKNSWWCAVDYNPANKDCFEPMTHFDQIKAMTDEELAEWLDNNTYRFPIYKDWLEWLKQEARDEP